MVTWPCHEKSLLIRSCLIFVLTFTLPPSLVRYPSFDPNWKKNPAQLFQQNKHCTDQQHRLKCQYSSIAGVYIKHIKDAMSQVEHLHRIEHWNFLFQVCYSWCILFFVSCNHPSCSFLFYYYTFGVFLIRSCYFQASFNLIRNSYIRKMTKNNV